MIRSADKINHNGTFGFEEFQSVMLKIISSF